MELKYPLAAITLDRTRVMMPADVAFFYEHAGFSYDPERETADTGRLGTAYELAGAERRATRDGWHVTWETGHDAETEPGEGYIVSGAPQYEATLRDKDGKILADLCGIDLGFDEDGASPKTPGDDPYARVVAAELALEGIDGIWSTRMVAKREAAAQVEDGRA